jgi:hypothetical protein
MKRFDCIPAIPNNYHRLQSLTMAEVNQAYSFSYVADSDDPSEPVIREGIDTSLVPYPGDAVSDWRVRIYLVWFCYIYENLNVIQNPNGAIDELVYEFQGIDIIDLPGRRLATLYAGTGHTPLSDDERKRETEFLKPHYEKAIRLIEKFDQTATVSKIQS